MKTFNFPDYITTVYNINNETSRYEKQPELMPFEKLPYELKVEGTREPAIIKNGANQIITGRVKNGKRLFFTGLIPVPYIGDAPVSVIYYYGNDYQKVKELKKNSIVLFGFSDHFKVLTIYYFPSWYKKNPEERVKFICLFIEYIQNL